MQPIVKLPQCGPWWSRSAWCKAIVLWWNNQVWQCVHKGWSTMTGNASGIIDQDRNWPNWQTEVRFHPDWVGRSTADAAMVSFPCWSKYWTFLWPNLLPLPQMIEGTVVQPRSSVSYGEHVHQDWWFDVKPNVHLLFWKQLLLLPSKSNYKLEEAQASRVELGRL